MKYSTKLIYLLFILLFGSFQESVDYRKPHTDAIVIDTHNDVVQRILAGEDISKLTDHGHSDLPRFKEGGIDVQVFSIWVPPQNTNHSFFAQANWQIDSVESFVNKNSKVVSLASSSSELGKLTASGKFVAMLGLEGGHPIENDLEKLEKLYQRGIRYMTLTWNNSTTWATSAKDEEENHSKSFKKGLSPFGIKVVHKMNQLGMIIDVSHLGEKSFWDVMKATRKPVIASHSCVWSLCPNRRNLKDAQIKAIAKIGGVVFINFAPFFIDSTYTAKEKSMLERNKARIDSFNKEQKRNVGQKSISEEEFLKDEYAKIRPPLSKLIDHFDYVAKLVGVEHVGIGSDFDGISVTPKDMDDVTYMPNITRELQKRGYSDEDIKKILGGNFIRVLKEVEVH